jgi:hypothetical protein
MFDNYLTTEMTGCLGAWDTFEARVSARPDEGVVMAYQGNCDGLVAAAYLQHTLRAAGVEIPRSRLVWVPVEDHEYHHLRSYVREQKPGFLITLSMPIESSPEALAEVVDSVQQEVFCFDHHVVGDIPSVDRLIVANPTPTLDLARTKPMPASLFGYLCAERAGHDAAPWLVGVGLLDEGVEEQMTFFYEELSRLHDLPSPGMVGGPGGLRQTIYGRITRLLNANFAAREPEHLALKLAKDVLGGKLPGPDELLDASSDRLARMSNQVTTEVRRHIDTWRQRINAYLVNEPLVKVEVPSEHSVAGPVASLLLQHFPDKVFVTYATRAGSALLELRGPSGGADLLTVLDDVSKMVPLHTYSGQKTTATAVCSDDKLQDVLEALSSKLDPDWDDED